MDCKRFDEGVYNFQKDIPWKKLTEHDLPDDKEPSFGNDLGVVIPSLPQQLEYANHALNTYI